MKGVARTLGALCFLATAQPGLSFGTINSAGQHAEHEHITRDALGCAPGVKSTGDCFEKLSILNLAGGPSTAGGVGAPDSDEVFNSAAHCDDADFLDHAKWGLPGTYPRTRAQATGALMDCVAHLGGRFIDGIAASARLLDSKDAVVKKESDLGSSTCTFFSGAGGRAKCEALEGFGRALHGVQDFYSHSNWADVADTKVNISRTNPPGLSLPASSFILDLRSAASPAGLTVPDDLTTGCFISSLGDPLGGAKECVKQGRITHDTLNKDKGIIRDDPSVALPPGTPLTSGPGTARGQVAHNFEQAVIGAIGETRRQWADFRAELEARYGPTKAAHMVCALTRDEPWKDCSGRQIAVVIDSSGSNQDTDPGNLRIAAGAQFVATLVTKASAAGSDAQLDKVAVIDFDDTARVVSPLGDPSTASFDGIDSEGGTSIASGVALAIDTLTAGTAAADVRDRAGIVVLTDGQDSDTSSLLAALDLAAQLGIRVSFGFLAPPANPVPVARRLRRSLRAASLRPLYEKRQFSGVSDPLSGAEPDVVAAILRTGGIFGTITSAEAQRRFVDLVVSHGATNIDGTRPGATNGGPLFPGVTVVALLAGSGSSPSNLSSSSNSTLPALNGTATTTSLGQGLPDTYTYRTNATGEHLNFTVQAITPSSSSAANLTLAVTLRDVRGNKDLGAAAADSASGGVASIAFDAGAAGTDLQLVVRASFGGGAIGPATTNSSSTAVPPGLALLYAVRLDVVGGVAAGNGTGTGPATNGTVGGGAGGLCPLAAPGANNTACSAQGELKCCGSGFLTCDHGAYVYRACGAGTVCRAAGASVFCDWP